MTSSATPPVWLALDPGTEETGFVRYSRTHLLLDHGTLPNQEVLDRLLGGAHPADRLVLEMVASYGMAVGRETFETVFWIGRFYQAWPGPVRPLRIVRGKVKLHLCHDSRARDSNLWAALTDRFGLPGTKKAPGALYGLRAHARAALALAVTADDLRGGGS